MLNYPFLYPLQYWKLFTGLTVFFFVFLFSCDNPDEWTDQRMSDNIDSCKIQLKEYRLEERFMDEYCSCSTEKISQEFTYSKYQEVLKKDSIEQYEILAPLTVSCEDEIEHKLGHRMTFFIEIENCKSSFLQNFSAPTEDVDSMCWCILTELDNKYSKSEKMELQEQMMIDFYVRDSCMRCYLDSTLFTPN